MLLGLCCLGLCLLGLCLLHHGDFRYIWPAPGTFASMSWPLTGDSEQADAAHLGASLDVCATLDLQALDDGDGVAVDELVTDGVETLEPASSSVSPAAVRSHSWPHMGHAQSSPIS